MAAQFFITKRYDRRLNDTGQVISDAEWRSLVEQSADLRFGTETRVAINPQTGEEIRIPGMLNMVAIHCNGEWQDFGQLSGGEIAVYGPRDFYDSDNPFRSKVAEITKALEAIVMCDASDDIFDW